MSAAHTRAATDVPPGHAQRLGPAMDISALCPLHASNKGHVRSSHLGGPRRAPRDMPSAPEQEWTYPHYVHSMLPTRDMSAAHTWAATDVPPGTCPVHRYRSGHTRIMSTPRFPRGPCPLLTHGSPPPSPGTCPAPGPGNGHIRIMSTPRVQQGTCPQLTPGRPQTCPQGHAQCTGTGVDIPALCPLHGSHEGHVHCSHTGRRRRPPGHAQRPGPAMDISALCPLHASNEGHVHSLSGPPTARRRDVRLSWPWPSACSPPWRWRRRQTLLRRSQRSPCRASCRDSV